MTELNRGHKFPRPGYLGGGPRPTATPYVEVYVDFPEQQGVTTHLY